MTDTPTTPPKTQDSATVRDHLIDALQLDLIGPELETDDGPHAYETLPQAPSRWYLTGFLVPFEAPDEQRYDEDGGRMSWMPPLKEGPIMVRPARIRGRVPSGS